MNIRWFIAAAGLALGHPVAEMPAATITNAPAARAYDIKFWETDEDLPQNSVLSMIQSRDGYLWLGTLNGLARFDGVRFTVFDENNTPGLRDSRIVFLFEDSNANLWIGTETAGTVIMRDGQVNIPVELARGGADRKLIGACEDADGAVWLYLANGDLWRFYRDRFTAHLLPTRESSLPKTIIREANGPIWIATGRRQFAVAASAESRTTELAVQTELAAGVLDLLVPSRRGGYWRLANFNIQKWETNSFRTLGEYRWWGAGGQPSAGCEDLEGNLVVGTERAGIFIVTPAGEITSLSTSNNLSRDAIRSVVVDREGILWVGTDGGGVNRVKRRPFDSLEAVRDWTVTSVAGDASGGLWIGSRGSGIGYWRSNSFMVPLGLVNAYVETVFVDRDQRVWAGTHGGLHEWRNGRFKLVSAPEANESVVQVIHQDHAGQMWFGTQGGLLRLENGTWKRSTVRDGLSSDDITAIADDAVGGIWIGTRRGGLNRWSDGKITKYDARGAPADISALFQDKEGVLWIGSFGNGLARFHNGKWTRYTKRDGLVSNNLGYLFEDQEGTLWIGSNHGVLRVPKKALNDFAAGAIRSVPCRAYAKTDGLPTRECTSGSQPGAWQSPENKLWFPTIRGLVSLDPTRLSPNMIPPVVTVDAVWVDDEPVTSRLNPDQQRTVTLRPRQERLEIQYSSVNLSAPDRARFRYRLEGEEKDWTETTDTSVKYKLDPGDYSFHVTACNEDGVWNETGSTLAVIVEPPFWKTWWFYGVTAGVFLALMGGIVHYVSTQKIQRQLVRLKQQEALEKERARIARDIHDQVGASLTQVALLGELVETDKDLPDEVQSHAQQISQTARETTRALDEIVWTVNPSNDTLEGLVNYICKHAQDFLAVAGLRYRLEAPDQLPALSMSPEVRHNVFLASKEAITNVVRHAKATAVWIRLRLDSSSFTIEIEDNGCGIADPNAPTVRNGLRNMRKRMDDIGGKFVIGRGKECGALVQLTVPITPNTVATTTAK